MIKLLSVVIAVAIFGSTAWASCDGVARGENPKVTRAIHDLSALRFKLDRSVVDGSNSLALSTLANDYRKKEDELAKYLSSNGIMNREELVHRIRQEIDVLQKKSADDANQEQEDRKAQDVRREKLLYEGTYGTFHAVLKGSFEEPITKRRVVIEEPFEMMAIPVTHFLWRALGDLIKNKYPLLQFIIEHDFKGTPTNPVTGLKHLEIAEWLKGLNRLSKTHDPSLAVLMLDHRDGDEYRLPEPDDGSSLCAQVARILATTTLLPMRKCLMNTLGIETTLVAGFSRFHRKSLSCLVINPSTIYSAT